MEMKFLKHKYEKAGHWKLFGISIQCMCVTFLFKMICLNPYFGELFDLYFNEIHQ